MKIFKFYDTCCDKCGNWYSSSFPAPKSTNKEQAIVEMKQNGWKSFNGKTICHLCK